MIVDYAWSVFRLKPGGPLKVAERDGPEPDQSKVRIRFKPAVVPASVTLCQGWFIPLLAFSIREFKGHEEAGIIDRAGKGATYRKPGQGGEGNVRRLALWPLRPWRTLQSGEGDFVTCVNAQVRGISYDGGGRLTTWQVFMQMQHRRLFRTVFPRQHVWDL